MDRRGSATLEFALIAPVLAALLGGILYFGMLEYQQMELQNAVQAGALYAARYGFNSAGIGQAIQSASSLGAVTLTPPATSCGCPSGSQIVAQSCTTATPCASGQTAGTYVTLAAQTVFSPPVTLPGFPATVTLSAAATTRIQ